MTEAREVLAALSRHADRDVEAFEAYMAAAGLPKSTDAEKSARRAALGAAALGAANAPLDAARDMVRALDLGVRIASLTKKAVASDVLAGSDLLGGAVIAALRNVDVNLGAISDEGERKRLAEERDGLLDKAEASVNEIRRVLAVSR
jgi:formiminotetrahydrofolate cyclodeaminase